ncbi:MAG: Uma2 family endonuclease, partial [Cyanobacteria bacterium J06631_12]
FLQLPETKPASEYIDGRIIQKSMPKGRHSRLQGKLCATINQVTEEANIAYAFPELRCSFILHCLEHGSHLGWFIDPDDPSILYFLPQQQPVLCRADQRLPVLPNLELTFTVDQVFSWLKMGPVQSSSTP